MAKVWIEDMSNLHCPTCDERLVAPAGRFDPMGKPDPTYVQDGGTLACTAGHPLPDQQALRSYADQHGHVPPPAGAPIREVPPPK